MTIIDKIVPYWNERVRKNTHKWFNSKDLEKLNARDKLLKKFKTSRPQINKDLHKKSKCDV